MSRIDSFQINNFKFFDEQDPIELRGKHLLLFGENGSGKSSIYWSLYTLFEASGKLDINDIKKYFKDINDSEETLINIHSTKVIEANGDEHFNSHIKVVTNDTPPINYEVSFLNTAISGNPNAIEVNQASDFINYKVLYKFQDFWNGEPMDLARIFEGYILSYLKFTAYSIWRGGNLKSISNA
jgi:predicted ATP-dependent endonuclease of OLD family